MAVHLQFACFLNGAVVGASQPGQKADFGRSRCTGFPAVYDGLEDYARLPFDGFAIRMDANAAGAKACNTVEPGRTAFSNVHWEFEWFAESTQRLAAANQNLRRETFLILNCNPGNIDWFDDAGWVEIVDHFRIFARVAKQSGSAGVIFDPEPYPSNKPVIPFCYERQPNRGRTPLRSTRPRPGSAGAN